MSAEEKGEGPQAVALEHLLVNDARTLVVWLWEDGTAEVATRASVQDTWGPPQLLTEEMVR